VVHCPCSLHVPGDVVPGSSVLIVFGWIACREAVYRVVPFQRDPEKTFGGTFEISFLYLFVPMFLLLLTPSLNSIEELGYWVRHGLFVE
jgi:hypothetical protein